MHECLPKEHLLRIRAVYFDDRHGEYRWYLDYLYPRIDSPSYTTEEIKEVLDNDNSHEDGQWYWFDMIFHKYSPSSERYDKDHYQYYEPFLEIFLVGSEREQ